MTTPFSLHAEEPVVKDVVYIACIVFAFILGFWVGSCRKDREMKLLKEGISRSETVDLEGTDRSERFEDTRDVRSDGYFPVQTRSAVNPGGSFLDDGCQVSHGLPVQTRSAVDPASLLVDGCQDKMHPFLNSFALRMWPNARRSIERYIKNEMEPAIQKKMPQAFRHICFDEAKLTLERLPPPCLSHAVVLAKEEQAVLLGSYENVLISMDMTLDGDCEVELFCDVPKCVVSGAALDGFHLAVGISRVKMTGTIIFELVRLMDKPPFIGGFRVYFADPPDIDLTLSGHFQSVLNLGFVKQTLIDVLRGEINQTIVLPHCVGKPLSQAISLSQVKTPRPGGLIRVQLLKLQGLVAEKVIVVLRLGSKEIASIRVGSDDVAAFIFHTRRLQHLRISVYETKQIPLAAAYRGKCLNCCSVKLSDMVAIDDVRYREYWCALEEGTFVGDRADHDVQPLLWEPTSGMCIQFGMEWRPFIVQQPRENCGFANLRAPGTSFDQDMRCMLAIGLMGVDGLGESLHQGRCWCRFDCSGKQCCHTNGACQKDDNVSMESPSVEVSDFCDASEPEETPDEDVLYRGVAQWNRSFLVPLRDPRNATVTVTVFCKLNFRTVTIGRVKHCMRDLLDKERPIMSTISDLKAETYHMSDRTPDGQRTTPLLRVVYKLWFLGHPHHVAMAKHVRERSQTLTPKA